MVKYGWRVENGASTETILMLTRCKSNQQNSGNETVSCRKQLTAAISRSITGHRQCLTDRRRLSTAENTEIGWRCNVHEITWNHRSHTQHPSHTDTFSVNPIASKKHGILNKSLSNKTSAWIVQILVFQQLFTPTKIIFVSTAVFQVN